MRIRKRARISPPPPPPLPHPISQQQQPSSSIVPDSPATHVCELNRSPWDVISFTSQSQEQYGFQIKVDDNDTCNRVRREPARSPDSITSLNEQYWAKKEIIEEANRPSLMVDVDKVKAKKKVNKVKKEEPDYICCNKTDGKGWYCKKEAKEGEVLCEHHIEQLKTYQFNYTYSCRKSTKAKPEVATATVAVATTTTTTMASKKRNRGKVSSPSPMDFYYYSGFGPKYSWGSRRRGGSEDKIKEIKKEENNVNVDDTNTNTNTNTNIAEATSSSAANVVDLQDYEHYDDVFDEFDDDEDDEYNGDKKRIRRPIKARSLKSLL